MTWVALLRLVLGMALAIANIVRERRLLDAGAQEEVARSLALLIHRTNSMDAVEREIELMSDEDLNAALRGDK